jgi:hypothetical protein
LCIFDAPALGVNDPILSLLLWLLAFAAILSAVAMRIRVSMGVYGQNVAEAEEILHFIDNNSDASNFTGPGRGQRKFPEQVGAQFPERASMGIPL